MLIMPQHQGRFIMAKGRKISSRKAPAVAMSPLSRAGSTFSDSDPVQTGVTPASMMGPQPPQGPVTGADAPQLG
jgi:hypothetical protein